MRYLWYLSVLVISTLLPISRVWAQDATITPGSQIVFVSPEPGQALQGTVLILAETDFDAPSTVSLSFSYHDDPRETWFLIQDIQNVGQQELSFEWDTTTITDGNYTLRLFARTEQGEHIASIDGLRVRNYTAVETSTPKPTSTPAPQDTPVPTITPTRTSTAVPPTATALPPNPAQITTGEVWSSIIKGALITLGFFGFLGVLQIFRNRRRNED